MKFMGIIFVAALLCDSAQAADKDGNYHVIGAGTMTCQKYLDANEKDRFFAETWWTGYVTAANRLTADTYSVVGKDPNDRVNEAIQKQCKDHPTILFAIAVHDAVQSLYNDHRVKVAPKE
jgi:hypothetical protein